MPVLTDLANAVVRQNVKTLYGQTLTRPLPIVTDGLNVTYGVDVNIGPTDPTGLINQLQGGNPYLTQLPGQPGYDPDFALTVNTILRNVPIAHNNADLIYADVNSPVELRRTTGGQWEVIGLSMEIPGSYILVAVDIPDIPLGTVDSTSAFVPPIISIGTPGDYTLSAKLLTYEELGTLAPYGTYPYGASGIYIGGVLIQVV